MLKQVTHDKLFYRKSALLNYSGCRRSNVRPTPHGLKPYRKFASWICSTRPYPPSAGREFCLSGFTTVGSICSLSGIHSLSFTHSVRKSASWICSALRKFRFRTYGSCQLNSFAIRTNSLRSRRPYANPLTSDSTP